DEYDQRRAFGERDKAREVATTLTQQLADCSDAAPNLDNLSLFIKIALLNAELDGAQLLYTGILRTLGPVDEMEISDAWSAAEIVLSSCENATHPVDLPTLKGLKSREGFEIGLGLSLLLARLQVDPSTFLSLASLASFPPLFRFPPFDYRN